MLKITFLAAMICCWLPTISKAQLVPLQKVVPCGDTSVVLGAVENYGELPVMIFNNAENGFKTIVFHNKDTGSTTVVETSGDGSYMCIISSGETEYPKRGLTL